MSIQRAALYSELETLNDTSKRRSNRKRCTTAKPRLSIKIPRSNKCSQSQSTSQKRKPSKNTRSSTLLSRARDIVSLRNISIMDLILDSRSLKNNNPFKESAQEPLLEAMDLFAYQQQHSIPQRSYVFTNLSSLERYWDQQNGVEDWSALITLANVSAERSTAAWSELEVSRIG